MSPKSSESQSKSPDVRLAKTDSWDLDLAEYACKSSSIIEQISEFLNDKRYTVKDSGATYRLINHWTDAGLIEDERRGNEEGWRRLSFLDLVWISSLVEMRLYGASHEMLEIARRAIFDLPDRPGVKRIEFEYAVAHCVFRRRSKFMILMFRDGHAEVINEDEFDLNRSVGLLDYDSFLTINLNRLCKKHMPSIEIPSSALRLNLSDKELSVIESLRLGEFDVVEVHHRDGEIDLIERRSKKQEITKKLDELARKIEFGEFTVKVQKGKAVVTQVSESKKA